MKQLMLAIYLLLCVSGTKVLAQGCSVCTKTAAGLDNKSARGLNGGIIYLALLPLGIMGTLGFVWWRHNKKEIPRA